MQEHDIDRDQFDVLVVGTEDSLAEIVRDHGLEKIPHRQMVVEVSQQRDAHATWQYPIVVAKVGWFHHERLYLEGSSGSVTTNGMLSPNLLDLWAIATVSS